MKIKKVNIAQKLKSFSEYWSPKVVGELNQQMVKIAKFKGEFVMHHHDNEDEFFYVINGELFIEIEDQTLNLKAGEFVIIPKGTDHKPYAPDEVHIMLFEPSSTLNTGNVDNNLTLADLDKI
ncbi:cupin domain-containing protein [Eudoraea chungangensis]|uniref:cupin domain-containing protein n=1 Tax=Eudoraea chungangensis TaxID=1481905 RepID=UPI0023ECDDB8|nr:cupin domain-containing protein [Eudoraea chungangensis]